MHKITDKMFEECQKFELASWMSSMDNFDLQKSGEVKKQDTYITLMYLSFDETNKINLNGKNIIDIGGGPNSILLRSYNFNKAVVVDPLNYPQFIIKRYNDNNISFIKDKGENVINYYKNKEFDECWIYNVLEHVQCPEILLRNINSFAKILRIFEWLELPPREGHPHSINEQLIQSCVDYEKCDYNIGFLNTDNLNGKYLSGIFYLK